MSSIILRIFVLIAILAVVSASHSKRERRVFGLKTAFNKIKGAAGAVGGGLLKAGGAIGTGVKVSAGAVGGGLLKAGGAIGTGVKVSAGAIGTGVKVSAGAVGRGIKGAAVGIGRGFTGSYRWMFNIDPKPADTVDEEAEIILKGAESTIKKGDTLVNKGESLLKKAEELEKSLGNSVGKRDDDQSDRRGVQGLIFSLREAAQLAINAGRKIASNSGKIRAALKDAVANISTVVSEGLVEVSEAFVGVSTSVAKAGVVLARAQNAATNLNLSLGDAEAQLDIANQLVVDAAKSFEEVGKRSLNLAYRIFKLGKSLVTVVGRAALNIFRATGLGKKK